MKERSMLTMATFNQTDFAKSVCDYMSEFSETDGHVPTMKIMGTLKVENDVINMARSVLHRLHDRGVLDRIDNTLKKGFAWKLLNRDYNRDNPLSTRKPKDFEPKPRPEQAPRRPNSPKPDPMPQGQTFDENMNEILPKPNNGPNQTALLERIKELSGEINDLRTRLSEVETTRKVEIVLKAPDQTDIKVEERVHPIFEQVMFHIHAGDNVMLVGPKGCGKTWLAEQIAKARRYEFGMISLSGGVTESKLFGRVTPNITTGKSEYAATQFVNLFEEGGLFLLDEVDAADPNVLLSINGALANGLLPLDRPKRPIARRHKTFVCMAAANTWGTGADRQYVGRNQQDSAFTERFVQIPMDYDKVLEKQLCPGASELVDRMHRYRDAMSRNRIERTLSTRFIVRAFNWLQHGKDLDYVDQMFFGGWRDDEVRKVKGGV